MRTQIIDTLKKPYVIIDNSPEQYDGHVFFPEKLAKANAILEKIGLPKAITSKSKIKPLEK